MKQTEKGVKVPTKKGKKNHIKGKLYFFIFLQASYLAIYKSNNQYVKIVGVYITFRWMYAFIHDGIEFNLNFLFIVIGLAICYSPQFRHMTALEFKHFINNSIK